MSDPRTTLDGMALTGTDLALLELEGRFYRHRGAKEQAIHDELGMSPTRYTQRLAVLLDDPDAYTARPMLMKRLRRVRDGARRDRVARRTAIRG